jgi:hypothetical protein
MELICHIKPTEGKVMPAEPRIYFVSSVLIMMPC